MCIASGAAIPFRLHQSPRDKLRLHATSNSWLIDGWRGSRSRPTSISNCESTQEAEADRKNARLVHPTSQLGDIHENPTVRFIDCPWIRDHDMGVMLFTPRGS